MSEYGIIHPRSALGNLEGGRAKLAVASCTCILLVYYLWSTKSVSTCIWTEGGGGGGGGGGGVGELSCFGALV